MINKEVWKERFKKILSLDSHPRHISLGFAVGVFISFTPFFGIHTPLAIAAAFIFRLNKLTCITGAWINTPITVVPVLVASHSFGTWILGRPHHSFRVKSLEWAALKANATEILLGSSLIGFVLAIAGYFICYWLIVRFRKKDEMLDELTREMEATGEALDE
ncbi:MAG: DUF2062 domain-containing protein [Geobacteraceae bacterium]|nr:DUF2062 domain-containing protein [Geobacteraceae bacterium]